MKTEITNTKRLNIPGNGDLLSNREILTALLKQWRQKLGYYSMFTALPAILTSFAQEAQAGEAKKPEVSVTEQTASLLEKLNSNCGKPKLFQPRSNYRLPLQKGKYNIISELAGGDDCPGTAIPAGIYTAAAPYSDSGNTTGANDTVSNHSCYFDYYGQDSSPGPDQIYTFTLTGRGANPQIKVSTTSSSYNPQIYILNGLTGARCPVGTGQRVTNCLVWSDNFNAPPTETIDKGAMDALPLNVPLYLFIDSYFNSNRPEGSGPYTLRIQDVTIAPVTAPTPRTRFDFDGDSKADISVFRPTNGTWYLNRSTQGFSATQFGLSTDKITPADFDGDGKTDIAVFRDGVWFWLNSSNGNFNAIQFGLASDIPVPADFTGDGRAELAVYRGGFWYTFDLSNNQFHAVRLGDDSSKPVPADFDGDGKTDLAVYRDGFWFVLRSLQGLTTVQFGLASDTPTVGDYDGDGKADQAVYRNGFWYILGSTQGFYGLPFGIASDIPVSADYDGDGKTDVAVYRDGVWYLLQSANGFKVVPFGLATDKPVPSAFLP